MGNIVILKAENFEADKQEIVTKIKLDPWFVLDNNRLSLDDYITNLHDQYDLKNKELTRLKICRNITWPLGEVTVIIGDGNVYRPGNMIELLENFPDGARSESDDGKMPLANIILENDNRKLLANIAQQLIYLAYPLAEIDIRRRKEFRDAESVRRLMQNIDELAQAANEAAQNLSLIKVPQATENSREMEEYKTDAVTSYHDIQTQIARARKLEMKVAVAASKKTGKSVLVNCLIGQELAPTSLEMATPNSCIYRKSNDDNYHLLWDKESEIYKANPDKFRDGTYASREEIHKAIDREFKAAQKDKENKFLIPDMIIEYVSNGNNFESYTIHDTPGPDAAGTDHGKSAKKAMQECDASIFAIDYAKYLTEDEEKYLADVKSIFEEKNKFHTLLFDINKLDMALQDSGAKSRVKSIDFIRNRLIAIDSKYEDCIIFATSALDYFNTITLEKACATQPELQNLLVPGSNWIKELGDTMDSIEDAGINLNESVLTALSNMDAETGKLKRMLGYRLVDMHEFREFSGIPQMMGYLGYILQCKAREEIVNYIAVTIDALSSKINNIINKGSNLLESLQWNESKIESIKQILEEYSGKVKNILDKRITDDDIAVANNMDYFKNIITILKKKQSELTFDCILDIARNRLKDIINPRELEKDLWQQYYNAQLHHFHTLKHKGKVFKKELPLPEASLNEIFNNIRRYVSHDIKRDEEKRLNNLADGLKMILENRFQKIRDAGAECRRKLDKENCALELPALPTFAVDFPEPAMSSVNFDASEFSKALANHSSGFHSLGAWDTISENMSRHGLKFWKYDKITDMVDLSQNSDKQFEEIIKSQKTSFENLLETNKIISIFKNMTGEIGKNSIASQENLLQSFYGLNSICEKAVEDFAKLIDERSLYEHKSSELKEFLAIIKQIEQASAKFMEIWHIIKSPEAEKMEISA